MFWFVLIDVVVICLVGGFDLFTRIVAWLLCCLFAIVWSFAFDCDLPLILVYILSLV